MQRPLLLLAAALAFSAAGCGGSSSASKTTTTTPAANPAVMSAIRVHPNSVVFVFRSPPQLVHAVYMHKDRIAQPVLGSVALVVRFKRATSAHEVPERVKTVFPSQRRKLPHAREFVREAVRTQDANSVLEWAIGLTGHRHFRVTRTGPGVTITFS